MGFAGSDGLGSGANRWQYAATSATPPAAATNDSKAGVRSADSRCSGFFACQERHSPGNWPAGGPGFDGGPGDGGRDTGGSGTGAPGAG
ncbi:hypothetical protein AB0B85_15565 [Micromonospora sp. NPDC049044]|uniref:hypothetical protein n=1 Tax=Micromonospora sp. NPDC049044 TaxID=3154827 RepID=UPI0033FE764B